MQQPPTQYTDKMKLKDNFDNIVAFEEALDSNQYAFWKFYLDQDIEPRHLEAWKLMFQRFNLSVKIDYTTNEIYDHQILPRL